MAKFALYSPMSAWKPGDPLVSPFVSIELDSYSEQDGHIMLSANLMTDGEINDAVDQLKKNLDKISNDAKKELRRLREEIQKK